MCDADASLEPSRVVTATFDTCLRCGSLRACEMDRSEPEDVAMQLLVTSGSTAGVPHTHPSSCTLTLTLTLTLRPRPITINLIALTLTLAAGELTECADCDGFFHSRVAAMPRRRQPRRSRRQVCSRCPRLNVVIA